MSGPSSRPIFAFRAEDHGCAAGGMGRRHRQALTTLVLASAAVFWTVPLAAQNANREPKALGDQLSALQFFSAEAVDDVTSYAGKIDVTTDLRTAIHYASSRGKGLFLPAGLYNIASGRISVPMGLQISGEGWGELPITTPNHGTIIRFAYPASLDPYGFYVTGSGAQIRNVEIDEPQTLPTACSFVGTLTGGSATITNVSYPNGCRPTNGQVLNAPNISYGTSIAKGAGTATITMAPATNARSAIALSGTARAGVFASDAFTPNIGPWAIYAAEPNGSRLTVDHVMLRNVYDGIALVNVSGGYLNDILGQPIDQGIRIDGDGDEPVVSNIRLGWTYFSGNPGYLAYQHQHATAMSWGRVDNPLVSNFFSFANHTAIRAAIGAAGGVSNAKIVNLDMDDCVVCLDIEDNPSMQITNFTAYPDPNYAGSTVLANPIRAYRPIHEPIRLDFVNGRLTTAYGTLMSFNAGSIVKPATINFANVQALGWDAGARGASAFAAAAGVTIMSDRNPGETGTDYARLLSGNGRLWYPGKGGAGWAEAADGTLTEWGSAPTAAGTSAIRFPHPFKIGVQSITANVIVNEPSAKMLEDVMIGSPTLTGVKLYPRFDNGRTVGPAGENVYWHAVGR